LVSGALDWLILQAEVEGESKKWRQKDAGTKDPENGTALPESAENV
jgi:hypothetical protein